MIVSQDDQTTSPLLLQIRRYPLKPTNKNGNSAAFYHAGDTNSHLVHPIKPDIHFRSQSRRPEPQIFHAPALIFFKAVALKKRILWIYMK